MRMLLGLVLVLLAAVCPARAQTPNTAAVVVLVVDQSGVVVSDATVTLTNGVTGVASSRAQTTYGDAASPNPTFGQVVSAGTASNALPSLANIDPPRHVRSLF